jgi:hypothetical protein
MLIESLKFALDRRREQQEWFRKISLLAQHMKQVCQRWPHCCYATLTRVWTAAYRQMLGHEPVHQWLVKAAEQNAPFGYPASKNVRCRGDKPE